jgi:anti-anti-sigma regulatory factor
METIKEHALGRVLILRWQSALDGCGLTPEQVVTSALRRHARYVLIDATGAPHADSNGVRWLLRLRHELECCGKHLRIAAPPSGKVGRALGLLQLGLETFESLGGAWKAPWGEAENVVAPRRTTDALRI